MSVQNFLLKKYAWWKMRGVPAGQRDLMMTLLDKDPQLMKTIGEEIGRRIKGGESETKAALEVMKKHRAQLAALLGR